MLAPSTPMGSIVQGNDNGSKEHGMRRQWLRNVSLVLSLVQVILSYRFSRLPRWARVLWLLLVQLPAFAVGTVRASRPSSPRAEWWFVGGQMLSITLAILG